MDPRKDGYRSECDVCRNATKDCCPRRKPGKMVPFDEVLKGIKDCPQFESTMENILDTPVSDAIKDAIDRKKINCKDCILWITCAKVLPNGAAINCEDFKPMTELPPIVTDHLCGRCHHAPRPHLVSGVVNECRDFDQLPNVEEQPTEKGKPVQVDVINHPSHYTFSTIEVLDAIEAWNLPYHLGNVVKYVARSAHKNKALEDLKKAKFYLDRFIKLVDEGKMKVSE